MNLKRQTDAVMASLTDREREALAAKFGYVIPASRVAPEVSDVVCERLAKIEAATMAKIKAKDARRKARRSHSFDSDG